VGVASFDSDDYFKDAEHQMAGHTEALYADLVATVEERLGPRDPDEPVTDEEREAVQEVFAEVVEEDPAARELAEGLRALLMPPSVGGSAGR
jgi:hypothetical protein